MNRNETCQSLNSTSWRSAKSTQNPESSLALHSCQKRDLCLSRSSRKIPESKAISGNRNNTGPMFAIRLGVVKATSFDVKHIITDSLTAARRAVDASVHSG